MKFIKKLEDYFFSIKIIITMSAVLLIIIRYFEKDTNTLIISIGMCLMFSLFYIVILFPVKSFIEYLKSKEQVKDSKFNNIFK